MLFEDKTIAFIGAGVMGGTIISGLVEQQVVAPTQIVAADPRAERGAELVAAHGIRFTTDNAEAVAGADVIVLAMKPQQIEKAFGQVAGHVGDAPLILSIVAGTKIRYMAQHLHNSRIVRSIPNTPGQIGQGISVWTATYEVLDVQRRQAQAILGALGEELYVEDESYLDMATAVSGSGPGYVFLFIEAMIDAGVRVGLSRPQAEKLVLQTIKGSVQYVLESGLHPAILRNQVTSPGGTTAAGLNELERHGLRTALSEAVWEAYQRSMELGQTNDK